MAAKKDSSGADEPKKLFEMSKQALERMAEPRFRKEMEGLT